MLTTATQGTLAMRNRFVLSLPSTSGNVDRSNGFSMTNVTAHSVAVDGGQLHYWMAGPVSAPVVVMTHGEGADHHSLDRQVELLSSTYRVLTWDLRGHGKSESVHPFSLDQAVEDLYAILSQENIDRAFFAGVSVGGLITQVYASRHPEMVQGLALMSCIPVGARPSFGERVLGRVAGGLLRTLPYWFVLAQIPARLSVRPEVQKYTVDLMQRSGQENFAAARLAQWEPFVSAIDYRPAKPLLVALGAYDHGGWTKRTAFQWSQCCPDSPPIIVPGAGHAIPQDNPSYTGKMLLNFINRSVRAQRFEAA